MAGLTLLQLRDASKQRADMVNTSYVSDAEWTFYINEGGSELHDLILLSDPNSIIVKQNINIVSSQEAYNLPADFYKLTAIYRVESQVRYYLDRTDLHGLGSGLSTLASLELGGKPYQYALIGDQIYFYPVPTGADVIALWYYPCYTRLVADTDVVDYPVVNGWEQFIILTAAIKAKMKEEDDIQAELAEKAELKARIVQMAASRDQFNAPRIRDTYGTTSRYRRYNMYGSRRLNNMLRWW